MKKLVSAKLAGNILLGRELGLCSDYGCFVNSCIQTGN